MSRVGASSDFASRMAPAAAAVALLVALAPPAVYTLVAGRLASDQARVYAEHLASSLRPVVLRQPRLWRYNAGKVVAATAPHRDHADIGSVRITDCAGATLFAPVRLAVGTGAPGGPAAWAPVRGHGGAVAWVEVRLDPEPHRRTRNLLALASGLLGLLLGGFVFLYPTRVVERQAARVEEGRSVVRVQEEERRRIARDLHDGLGQSLTALKLGLEAARTRPDEAGERLAGAERTCDETLDELRRVVHDLRPAGLEAGDVVEVLRALTERFELRTGVRVSLSARLGERPSEELSVALLRITQEALTNVGKHSEATEVGVALEGGAGHVVLTVHDDGVGLLPEAGTAGSGLAGIRERVAFLGGTFDLESKPGEGARLTARLPLR